MEINFEKKIINLTVLELDFHLDSLDGFIKIFEGTNYHLTVYTTKKNMNFLSEIHYEDNIKFVQFNGYSKLFFLVKHIKSIKLSDLIFINTIGSDFGAYIILPNNIPKILVSFRILN